MIPKGLVKEIKTKFTQLKRETSTEVTIFGSPEKEDCPNCIASIEDASLNIYNSSFTTPVVIFGETINPTPFSRGRCPVCYGKGYLSYESSTVIKALVRWNPPDSGPRGYMVEGPGGIEGKNVVRVKADVCYYEKLRDCEYIKVSNIKCELLNPPVFRSANGTDFGVTAYFISTEPGHSVRE